MSDQQSLELKGVADILNMLKGLPAHLEQEILQKYLRSASIKHGVEPMKAGLNVSPEAKMNIKVTKDKLQYLALVSGPTTKSFWLRFADRGTVNRVAPNGGNRGRIVGKFKIPGIVQGQIQPIIDESGGAIGEEIEKYLNKNKNTSI